MAKLQGFDSRQGQRLFQDLRFSRLWGFVLHSGWWRQPIQRNISSPRSAMNMKVVSSSQTLVPIYQTMKCHNPENHSRNLTLRVASRPILRPQSLLSGKRWDLFSQGRRPCLERSKYHLGPLRRGYLITDEIYVKKLSFDDEETNMYL
jgi:hypothetical protein